MKFFSNTLSNAGSNSSPTSSISSGRPSEIASSKCCLKYLWFKFVILNKYKLFIKKFSVNLMF
jgi:hypothetical protein